MTSQHAQLPPLPKKKQQPIDKARFIKLAHKVKKIFQEEQERIERDKQQNPHLYFR